MPVAPTTSGSSPTARCTARSPGRWRSGSRCAGCAPCTCGSSGRRRTPLELAARLGSHPAVERVRHPGFGGIVVDRGRRRGGGGGAGRGGHPGVGARDEPRRGREPARAAPPHPERAGEGAGEPDPPLGRHRGRRRPLARPGAGPRPRLTATRGSHTETRPGAPAWGSAISRVPRRSRPCGGATAAPRRPPGRCGRAGSSRRPAR